MVALFIINLYVVRIRYQDDNLGMLEMMGNNHQPSAPEDDSKTESSDNRNGWNVTKSESKARPKSSTGKSVACETCKKACKDKGCKLPSNDEKFNKICGWCDYECKDASVKDCKANNDDKGSFSEKKKSQWGQ